jgi:dTDP-4-amino-4,6-dideoxygalactose transaminase
VGSRATVTAFSFYATKNLTTGEGGAAVTNDEELHERMRSLSLHGMSRDAWLRYTDKGSWYYEITAPGFKYNLSDVLAAIGVGQLERFDEMQRRRHELCALYDRLLADVPAVGRPTVRPGITHARHLYAIQLDLDRLTIDRAVFIRELRAENIGSSVHFIPIHVHPHFRQSLGYADGAFPVAERCYARAVSLPLFATMTDRDVEDVCAAVRKLVGHFAR